MRHRRQDELGLRVGGGNAQAAAIGVGVFARRLLDALDVVEQRIDVFEYGLASGGNSGQFLAGTFKNLDIQFFFKQLDLVADTGLRGIEFLGGRGDIEVITDNGIQKS